MKLSKKLYVSYKFLMIISLLSISTLSNAQIPQSDVKMMSTSGIEYSVNDLIKANGTLIVFVSNDCNVVIKSQQRLIAVSDIAIRQNIGVIYINSNGQNRGDAESLEAMKRYGKSQGYNWGYLIDKNGSFASALGATRTPEVFLYNKDGQLVFSGAIDDNPANELGVTQQYLRTAIEQMNAGKPVSIKKSKVIGCAIKN
ncbi:MAG: redoxin family protein [Ferruginibacter sp.]